MFIWISSLPPLVFPRCLRSLQMSRFSTKRKMRLFTSVGFVSKTWPDRGRVKPTLQAPDSQIARIATASRFWKHLRCFELQEYPPAFIPHWLNAITNGNIHIFGAVAMEQANTLPQRCSGVQPLATLELEDRGMGSPSRNELLYSWHLMPFVKQICDRKYRVYT